MHFCFNYPRDLDVGLRSQKGERLKDFEVHGVPEKEPPHNGQKSYQPVQHDHLPKEKRKFWYKCPIVLSTAMPNRHLSEHSVRSEGVEK
jgi:hypothetical protein